MQVMQPGFQAANTEPTAIVTLSLVRRWTDDDDDDDDDVDGFDDEEREEICAVVNREKELD